MLEKLTTHDIQDVSALFSLVDKCAKAAEGRAWHSSVTQAAKRESKPNAETQHRAVAMATTTTTRRLEAANC
jgi:hypothetical protein